MRTIEMQYDPITSPATYHCCTRLPIYRVSIDNPSIKSREWHYLFNIDKMILLFLYSLVSCDFTFLALGDPKPFHLSSCFSRWLWSPFTIWWPTYFDKTFFLVTTVKNCHPPLITDVPKPDFIWLDWNFNWLEFVSFTQNLLNL